MRRKLTSFAPVMIAVILLAACAPSKPLYWQHKSLPSDQWRADQRACHRAVDQHLGLNPGYHADQAGISELQDSLRRYEVGRKSQKLMAQCMTRKGYVPVK